MPGSLINKILFGNAEEQAARKQVRNLSRKPKLTKKEEKQLEAAKPIVVNRKQKEIAGLVAATLLAGAAYWYSTLEETESPDDNSTQQTLIVPEQNPKHPKSEMLGKAWEFEAPPEMRMTQEEFAEFTQGAGLALKTYIESNLIINPSHNVSKRNSLIYQTLIDFCEEFFLPRDENGNFRRMLVALKTSKPSNRIENSVGFLTKFLLSDGYNLSLDQKEDGELQLNLFQINSTDTIRVYDDSSSFTYPVMEVGRNLLDENQPSHKAAANTDTKTIQINPQSFEESLGRIITIGEQEFNLSISEDVLREELIVGARHHEAIHLYINEKYPYHEKEDLCLGGSEFNVPLNDSELMMRFDHCPDRTSINEMCAYSSELATYDKSGMHMLASNLHLRSPRTFEYVRLLSVETMNELSPTVRRETIPSIIEAQKRHTRDLGAASVVEAALNDPNFTDASRLEIAGRIYDTCIEILEKGKESQSN